MPASIDHHADLTARATASRIARRVFVAGAAVTTAILLQACGTARTKSDHAIAAPTADVFAPAGSTARLFAGMGNHSRPVTTSSIEAKKYFDQGLIWSYAFNHDEAIRCFRKAVELDPGFAMAWWGIALCNGPHINNPAVSESQARDAWEAAQRARSLAAGCSPVERALIDAVAARYSSDPLAERRPLDEAYAAAMRGVWRAFSDDDDVATMFAESLMDLRPWDLWQPPAPGSPAGTPPTPQPGTEEIVAVLERALALNPNNPGANHLYIHTMEASPHPERALAAADRLRDLVPAAGHLVHMPAHIDIRVGNWQAAIVANRRAVAADAGYQSLSPEQGFYRVYMAHNHHFLSFAAMMHARKREAITAARDMVSSVPPAYIESSAAMIDPYMSIVYDVQKRFGMWSELLDEPAPDARLVITTAMWRFNRAVALAALGRLEDCRAERDRFVAAAANVPEGAMMAINPASKILGIASRMLEGEIALAEGDLARAVERLRAAVEIEDTLRYMEPPDWIQPVRHALGAVLVKAGRFAEAQRVYRDDLAIWPENAWSLKGLSQSLSASGRQAEAEAVDRRAQAAWNGSDFACETTCLCVANK